MKNVKIKVRYHICLCEYDYVIYEGRKILMYGVGFWKTAKAAIRNAKVMAKRIGIKYDPEIIKQHGC